MTRNIQQKQQNYHLAAFNRQPDAKKPASTFNTIDYRPIEFTIVNKHSF